MNLNFQIMEMFQHFFKNPRILLENSVKAQFSSPFPPRWRLILFSHRRVQTYLRMMMCASFDGVPLNTYLFNIASLFIDE